MPRPFIDDTALGAVCAMAMARALEPIDPDKSQYFLDDAIRTAQFLGYLSLLYQEPELFSPYRDLRKAYAQGHACRDQLEDYELEGDRCTGQYFDEGEP